MNVQENKLEELLAGDDLGAVEAYLASFSDLDRDSLRIHYLAVVRKTKNYAALPLLRASLPSIHSRKLYPLLADAVREGYRLSIPLRSGPPGQGGAVEHPRVDPAPLVRPGH